MMQSLENVRGVAAPLDPACVEQIGLSSDSAKPAARKAILRAIGPCGEFCVKGQTAKALAALLAAGERGVTAQEVAGWAFRFSAYCFDLRHKHCLDIETLHEKHEGGWHGRHVLRSQVLLIDA